MSIYRKNYELVRIPKCYCREYCVYLRIDYKHLPRFVIDANECIHQMGAELSWNIGLSVFAQSWTVDCPVTEVAHHSGWFA